jgi:hypothetical protein
LYFSDPDSLPFVRYMGRREMPAGIHKCNSIPECRQCIRFDPEGKKHVRHFSQLIYKQEITPLALAGDLHTAPACSHIRFKLRTGESHLFSGTACILPIPHGRYTLVAQYLA